MTLDREVHSWRGYLTSQSIVSFDDELLLDVFESSLCGAPLPAPWSMWFDKKSNALFFTNTSTGETSWTHPLNSLLLELASVGQRFLALPTASRAEHLAALNRTWEAEARAEILRWRSAYDNGAEYFYNIETKAVMWERPVDALLPAFYLKKQYLKNLSSYCNEAQWNAEVKGKAARQGKQGPQRQEPQRQGQQGLQGHGFRASLPLTPEQSNLSESLDGYLTKELLKLPDDEELLRVFQVVLREAPLPAPWSMWCDKATQSLFFRNPTTLETSWMHPLHDVFAFLAEVGRRFFTVPSATRAEHLAALNTSWDNEAREEILKWQAAYDEQDREYFFNVETMEVMWERPAEAVLPAFYLKKQFLKRLSLCKPARTEHRGRSGERDRDSLSTMASTSNSSVSSMSRRGRRSSRKLSNHALFDDNWEYYLTTQGIVNVPGEEMLLQTFQTVLKIAPLPAPWKIWNDKANNRFFFVHKSTGMTSWQHPLNSVLAELAGIARHFLSLREDQRADRLSVLGSTWDGQAEVEISKWKCALDEEDMEYFFNVETSETMWERPEDIVLPELFLKRQFLSKLSAAAEPSCDQSALEQPQPPQSQPRENKPSADFTPVPSTSQAPMPVPSVKPAMPPVPPVPPTPSMPPVIRPQPELHQAKPPLPRPNHSPTRVKIKSVSPKPARPSEAIKVTVVRKTVRASSRDDAPKPPKVTVISRDRAAKMGPTISVRAMKAQASPQHEGAQLPQLRSAKSAAFAASEATTGNSIEKIQAAALAAYEATPLPTSEAHVSTVQEALCEVARQIEGLTSRGEACSALAENAYFFARCVHEAQNDASQDSSAALASTAARASGLSASWQVDAAIAATLNRRFSGSPGSPSFPTSSQLREVIEQVACDAGVEAKTRESWLQKANEKLEPLQVKDCAPAQEAKSQDLVATVDTWVMGSPQNVDSSPQSGTAETVSMFGRTGRFSQTGSSKFAEFCNFRDVRRAMAEAENCLATFEEERRIQRKALRRRSQNKLPTDILDAMGEAQRILSAFDEERRLQLQQLRVERAKSRTNL